MNQIPTPEHQSIFTDTHHGVLNPNIPHTHPYPTRFHGPVYTVPTFGLPYRQQSWQVPAGLPTPPAPRRPCIGCSGFGAEASLTSEDLKTAKGTNLLALKILIMKLIQARTDKQLPPNVGVMVINAPMTGPFATMLLQASLGFVHGHEGRWPEAAGAWGAAKKSATIYTSTASPVVSPPMGILYGVFDQFEKEDTAKAAPTSGSTYTGPMMSVNLPSQPLPSQPKKYIGPLRSFGPGAPTAAALEEGFPWLLVIGGVAVVGTVGYLVLRKKS